MGSILVALIISTLTAMPARATGICLIINPTFLTTITGDPNAATIETTIDNVIGIYEHDLTTPTQTTVNISFGEMSTGLGQSTFFFYQVGYQAYYNALASDATSTTDTTALSMLPNQYMNPVNNTANLYLKSANVKALGLDATAFGTTNGVPNEPASDGTIDLNTSIMNLSRTGTQNPNFYDLQTIVEHEIDEILGLGSIMGTGQGTVWPSPEDLFRYTGTGPTGSPCATVSGRSYSSSSSAVACFSINGTTGLAQFNQNPTGDYGDWAAGTGTVQVQDAYGTPGSEPNLGLELQALDAIGYNLTSVTNPTPVAPEPGTAFLMICGAAVIGVRFSLRTKE